MGKVRFLSPPLLVVVLAVAVSFGAASVTDWYAGWGYPRLVDILTGWAMPRQERMPSWVRRGRVTPRSSVPRLRVW